MSCVFLLISGNFGYLQVGQLSFVGEFLVQCSSAEDANKHHHKVKVCYHTVIGFRKLERVYVVPEMADVMTRKIRNANPDEYKLHKESGDYAKEMRKILMKGDSEVGSSKDESETGASLGDPAACSKKRKL